MTLSKNMWYSLNEEKLDVIISKIIIDIKSHIYIPNYLQYSISLDDDGLKQDLIQYFYNNKNALYL